MFTFFVLFQNDLGVPLYYINIPIKFKYMASSKYSYVMIIIIGLYTVYGIKDPMRIVFNQLYR